VTRQRPNSRGTKMTRRSALLAAAAGALTLGRAGPACAADKRPAAVLPNLTFSAEPARPVAGEFFTIKVTAAATNPRLMGLVVCDLSRKGRKALRQTFVRGTIVPGQTATFTFRPAATDDKKISIRVIAWDKEHPPQKGDDIRKVLFRQRRAFTFA
jgi:hypothetical protein